MGGGGANAVGEDEAAQPFKEDDMKLSVPGEVSHVISIGIV